MRVGLRESMEYFVPDNLPEALATLADGDVKIIAGCTDYFPMLGDRQAPAKVLDVSALTDLQGVVRNANGWSIGANTTWTDIINVPLPAAFDGLKNAARQVGSIQIQNAGTIAGNLCNASPAADGVPPLLTLNATVELQSIAGTRTVPLSDFIVGVRKIDLKSDELLTAIHIPDVGEKTVGRFLKLGSRKFLVISIAMVSAVVLTDDGGRIELVRVAVGSCSATALRLGELETALAGQTAAQLQEQPEIWTKYLGNLSPIDDVRGSGEYRLEAAGELCKRVVLEAMSGSRELADG